MSGRKRIMHSPRRHRHPATDPGPLHEHGSLPCGVLAAESPPDPAGEAPTATLPVRTWTPPAAAFVLPAAFPDRFEVLVFEGEAGATLVAAIELVSPANKDRAAHRRAFAVKCASYLCQGVSLIVIDIVTSRQADLHREMLDLLGHGDKFALPPGTGLYAVAYRPVVRDGAG